MALESLKHCKKCVIQNIINPGKYLIVECENEEYYKRKLKQFERLLACDVEKYSDSEEIHIGQVVALKDEKGFHRGTVIDIFNRKYTTMYWILLKDSGKMIEAHERNIYMIKTQTLKDQMTSAFEMLLHGVQPGALDINCQQAVTEGIFQLRKCDDWSSGAFKFVKSLFLDNPYVFVSIINCEKNSKSGDIYYLQESDWKPVSLSQKLCDEGFAVLCDNTVKYSECGKQILEKIPKNALFSDSESHMTLGLLNIENKTAKGDRNSSTDESTITPQMPPMVTCFKSNPSSANNKVLENKHLRSGSVACESNANRLRISSNLKNNSVTSSSHSNSVKTPSKEDTNDSNEDIKLNICRIVMRNLNFFHEQKHISSQN